MQFSIIIPTFNRSRTLARAIESVCAQDFEDWELIIADDGSTDDTATLVKEFTERDPRISYKYSMNQGAAMARNFGCSFASGRYLTFLDSDDEYLPHHLSARNALLSQTPSIELLHGGVEVIGEQFVADKYDSSKLIAISDCIVGGTFCIRRDLFKRVGGFSDVPYSDDNDFFMKAKEFGAMIIKTSLPTYRYYRTQPDSLCRIVERDGIEGIAEYRRNPNHYATRN